MNHENDELVHRTNHQTDYLRVSNKLAQDYDILSAESFGWLVRFLSRPKYWRICVQSCICRHHGKSQLYRVIRELREARFIVSIEFRNDLGHRTAVANHIFDQPQSEDQISAFCIKQAGIYMRPKSQDPISQNPIPQESDTTKDSIIKRTENKKVSTNVLTGAALRSSPELAVVGMACASNQTEEDDGYYESMAQKESKERECDSSRASSCSISSPSNVGKSSPSSTVGPGSAPESQTGFELKFDDEPHGKDFPYGQLSMILARELPMMKMKTGAPKRDAAMKRWWQSKGKVVGSFELLARKIRESDFLMGRNGHNLNGGKPYSWSWFFEKRECGNIRADLVLADFWGNEKMNGIRDRMAAKNEKAKLTKVIRTGSSDPVEVNLEELHNGEKRYHLCKELHHTGMPEVIDLKD